MHIEHTMGRNASCTVGWHVHWFLQIKHLYYSLQQRSLSNTKEIRICRCLVMTADINHGWLGGFQTTTFFVVLCAIKRARLIAVANTCAPALVLVASVFKPHAPITYGKRLNELAQGRQIQWVYIDRFPPSCLQRYFGKKILSVVWS